MPYLDTSILGSYYCPKVLSALVNQALVTLSRSVISPLVEVELCSLVALKVRMGELSRPAASKILGQFRQHIADDHYIFLEITPREYTTARTWLASFQAPLRTLDALHMACAFNNGEVLWTTDKSLAKAATVFRIPHKLIC